MDNLSSPAKNSNDSSSSRPHYVYTYAYPESMGGHVFYIGKGKGNRIYAHERAARRNNEKDNVYKENVIRKIWANDEQVVKEKIAFFETSEEGLMYEISLIFFMSPYGHLTNMTDGGEGWTPSEEIRRKISEAKKGTPSHNKGKPLSEEQKQRLREVNLGKHLSAEVRQKIGEGGRGRKFSEEHRQRIGRANTGKNASEAARLKIGAASKGRHHSEKTRRKIGEASKGNKNLLGHIHSEETRRKMSETHKGRMHTEESKLKMSIAAKERWKKRKGEADKQ